MYSQKKPNIILILADDLGWNDLSCTGNRYYETPNIDKLSESGIRFTQAYSSHPTSSPTRAGILTGLHPSTVGYFSPGGHLATAILKPTTYNIDPYNNKTSGVSSVTRLDTAYYTLPEALKDNGYKTLHLGKWHLGLEPYTPLNFGFDEDYPAKPHLSGPAGGYFYPNPEVIPNEKTITTGEHVDMILAKKASEFIKKNKDTTFYINYWMYSIHSPHEASVEYMEYFKNKKGNKFPGANPVTAAMIKHMDDCVGEILNAVKAAGIENNTIVVFASDNGGITKQLDAINKSYEYGRNLPVTDNTPLRGQKGTPYEGGVRIPLIIKYPNKIKKGILSNQIVSTTDFYPTFLELTGITPKVQFDGKSIVPSLKNEKNTSNMFFCHFASTFLLPDGEIPATTIRVDDWKLIKLYNTGINLSDSLILCNLNVDPSERFNFIMLFPEIANTLIYKMDSIIKKTRTVIPYKNPFYKPITDNAHWGFSQNTQQWLFYGADYSFSDNSMSVKIKRTNCLFFSPSHLNIECNEYNSIRILYKNIGNETNATLRIRTNEKPDFSENKAFTCKFLKTNNNYDTVQIVLPKFSNPTEKINQIQLSFSDTTISHSLYLDSVYFYFDKTIPFQTQPTVDTIYITDTIFIHDTFVITDTIVKTDTVYVYDTIRPDSIVIREIIIKTDTLFVSKEKIIKQTFIIQYTILKPKITAVEERKYTSFPDNSKIIVKVSHKAIIIESDNSIIQSCRLYAINGKLIHNSITINSNYYNIDFSNEKSGVYVLHIFADNTTYIQKIIK
ncbi:MAG: sulfatase-like hydrolase/transferase [Bacteroidales bacterium]